MLDINEVSIEMDDEIIIDKFSLSVHQGEILHLQGINGAGKTTLLKAIMNLYPISSGQIKYKVNQDLIGYIGHKLALEPLLSVAENLKFAVLGALNHFELNAALAKLNFISIQDRLCSQLSQGQKKRLSLARFYLLPYSLWLLDEPFNALDTEQQLKLKTAMQLFAAKGGSIIVTSHNELQFSGIAFREILL